MGPIYALSQVIIKLNVTQSSNAISLAPITPEMVLSKNGFELQWALNYLPMSKRRLSERQKGRIQSIQEQRRERAIARNAVS